MADSGSGWTKHFDATYQTHYYSHPVEGSRWEAPPGFVEPEVEPSLKDEKRNSTSGESFVSLHTTNTNTNTNTNPSNNTSTGINPNSNSELKRLDTNSFVAPSAIYATQRLVAEPVNDDDSASASHSFAPVLENTVNQNINQPHPQLYYQPSYPFPVMPQQQLPYQYQQPAMPYVTSPQQLPYQMYANPQQPISPYEAAAWSQGGSMSEKDAMSAAYYGNIPAGFQPSAPPAEIVPANPISEKERIQSEDEAYLSRLPAGAKRVSYGNAAAASQFAAGSYPTDSGVRDLYDEATKPISASAAVAGSYGTRTGNTPLPQPPLLQANTDQQRGDEGGLRPSYKREDRGDRRRFCCCFRTRKGCCVTIWLMVVVLLGGLGVAAYFLWPRIPTITVSPATIDPSAAAPFSVSGSPTTASQTQPFQVLIYLAVGVNVYSPNFESITVNDVSFSGLVLESDNTTPLPGATVTGHSGKVTFPGKSSINFTLPVTVAYTLASAGGAVDGIALFASKCGGGGGDVQVKYTVSVDLAVISWTGWKPSFDGVTSFTCPDLSGSLQGLA